MILHRFSTDGDSIFYDDLRFRFGQDVSFQGVTRISQPDPEVFLNLFQHLNKSACVPVRSKMILSPSIR